MGQQGSILRPGVTCWRLAEASRIAFLVDACDYYKAVADAFEQARHCICIVGWDFDSAVKLRPDRDGELPLGPFLRSLVERTPTLHIRLMIWRGSIVYGRNAEMSDLLFADWWDHPRIDFRYDGTAPVGASHHEKIVVIDDSLAFLGGMDLTQERWDDCRHEADSPARVYDGTPYCPVHDVQVMFAGEAARLAADAVHERWHSMAGERLESRPPISGLWPANVAPAVECQKVALARTRPEHNGQPGVREVEAQLLAAIGAARHVIYIETQYFALPAAGDALAELLEKSDGPEIILVVMQVAQGVLEQYAMSQGRDRLFARLASATYRNRIGMFYPVARHEPACEIKVHSKLLAVDDTFLRIGSSNLNRRSMGVDTEFDLAFETGRSAVRAAIRDLRDGLLAEHLDTDVATWRATLSATGSYIRAISRLNVRERGFKAYDVVPDASASSSPGMGLFDPDKPIIPSVSEITEALIGSGDKATAKPD